MNRTVVALSVVLTLIKKNIICKRLLYRKIFIKIEKTTSVIRFKSNNFYKLYVVKVSV